MGVSKVVYGNNTLIDLTADTVTASDLRQGVTAHGADGNAIVGSAPTNVEWGDITGTLSDQTDLQATLDDIGDDISDLTSTVAGKQDELTATGGVNITNNTISTAFTDIRNTTRTLPQLADSIFIGFRTTIYASSWSSTKVEYYGKYWYKYDLALSDLGKSLITSVPIIGISGVDEYTPPTAEAEEAFGVWDYAFADTYNNSINFISSEKPQANFSVIILGVI